MSSLHVLLVMVAVASAFKYQQFSKLDRNQVAEWNMFKKLHKIKYSNTVEDERHMKTYFIKKNITTNHNRRYDQGQESYKLKVNQFASMDQKEYRKSKVAKGFILPNLRNLGKGFILPNSSNHQFFNLHHNLVDEWNMFKKLHKIKYNNTVEDERHMKTYFMKKNIVANHNRRYDQGQESYKLKVNQFASMDQKEYQNVAKGFILPKSRNLAKGFILPNSSNHQFFNLDHNQLDEWNMFKKLHKIKYNNTVEDERHMKTYFMKKNIVANHNRRYDQGQESHKLEINQFASMDQKEYQKVAKGFILPNSKNLAKGFILPNSSNHQFFNLHHNLVDEWNMFKKLHKIKYNNTVEDERHMKTYFMKKNIVANHNRRYDQGQESYKLKVNQFASMDQKEYQNVAKGFILPKSRNLAKGFILPNSSNHQFFNLDHNQLDEWNMFKKLHKIKYSNTVEDERHMKTYFMKKNITANHNRRYDQGQESYKLKVNQFASMDQKEYRKSKVAKGFILPNSRMLRRGTTTTRRNF